MAKRPYYDSPFGPLVGFPHLNKPDTKYNADGLYHAKQQPSREEGEKLKARLDASAAEALEDFLTNGKGAEFTAGEKKKWKTYVPYEMVEDDDGNPTGDIVFGFKQNHTIKLSDGTEKKILVGLYDAKGNELPASKLIMGGSVVRFRYSMRPTVMTKDKMVGIRLDFAMVQVKELSSGGGGQKGFGAVEGYSVDEDDDAGPSSGGTSPDAPFGDGDY